MKIGIITYHRAKNLGGMLQAYALQQVLNEKVGDCEIIDYRNKKFEDQYRIKKISEEKNIKNKVKNLLLKRKNVQFEKVRDEFNSNIQNISKEQYNEVNIEEANKKYDLFVTGSDQVWNTQLNFNDLNYFLKFVKDDKKKNSYAASFGKSNIDDNEKEEIIELLNTFNQISVREEAGKKIITENVKKQCEVVLDPTLLLNKSRWEKLIVENERLEKEKYIFVYIIAPTPSLLNFARKLGKEKKAKVICFHNGYQRYSGVKNLNKVSPIDFLNYIKYAECIVTSSFHGFCFSVNFHKEFFYELDINKKNNNSRLITLAKKLGLENREIVNGAAKNNDKIDYNIIEEKLNNQRQQSMNFIMKLGKGESK